MALCLNQYCGRETHKFQTVDGKSVNFVSFGGKESVLCEVCIKKIVLSIFAQKISNKGDVVRQNNIWLQKLANDKTIEFIGKAENIAKVTEG